MSGIMNGKKCKETSNHIHAIVICFLLERDWTGSNGIERGCEGCSNTLEREQRTGKMNGKKERKVNGRLTGEGQREKRDGAGTGTTRYVTFPGKFVKVKVKRS